jgi:hypothetical protein
MPEQQRLDVRSRSRLALALLVGSLYVAACACPAVEFTVVDVPRAHDFGEIDVFPHLGLGPHTGLAALLCGWAGAWAFPWFANVFLLAGLILLLVRRNALALGFGTAAALLGFSTWPLFRCFQPDPNESSRLLVGAYLWQASLIVFASGALVVWLRERRNPRRTDPNCPPARAATGDA